MSTNNKLTASQTKAINALIPTTNGARDYPRLTDAVLAKIAEIHAGMADALRSARNTALGKGEATDSGVLTLTDDVVAKTSGMSVEAFGALPPAARAMLRAGAQAKAKGEAARVLRLKVSDKGCVSVYSGARFPISPYAETFVSLLVDAEKGLRFVGENFRSLSFVNAERRQATADKLLAHGIEVSAEDVAAAPLKTED